jgi:hypothetical protein
MKRLLRFSMLGVLAVSALAQSAQDLGSVRIPSNQRIELPSKIYRMWPEDFDKYRRIYDLSNGQTMSMTRALQPLGRKMYAKVGDGPRTEIVAVAPNVFVALNKQLKITLEETAWDDFRGEVLMVVPNRSPRQAAAGSVEVARLTVGR